MKEIIGKVVILCNAMTLCKERMYPVERDIQRKPYTIAPIQVFYGDHRVLNAFIPLPLGWAEVVNQKLGLGFFCLYNKERQLFVAFVVGEFLAIWAYQWRIQGGPGGPDPPPLLGHDVGL